MAKEIVMPKLGLTMTEGTIDEWKKKEGDAVAVGEVLFAVSTDKLTNDVEATVSGTLLRISVPAGGTVPCLATVGYIGAPGEQIAEAPAPAAQTAAPAQAAGGTVLVIGGGPGGYVAAIRAAQLGASVTLVERAEIGGTCLNRGCMPTKALLHSSEVFEQATHSESLGIIARDVAVDWERVQSNRAAVTKKLTDGVRALVKLNKITLVEGEAVFTAPKTVSVGGRELTAEKIIIAAGSYPIMPPIPGVKDCPACIDSTGCLTLDHVPESLLVIGGGVIGIELGSVYQRFGTRVTIIEMLPGLLPLMDSELTAMVRAQLEAKGMEIHTQSQVLSVAKTAKGASVKVKCPEGESLFEAEKVLVCVGRGPNTAALGLEKAGIAADKGFIKVNDAMETNVPGVYAIGDCNGRLMLAHAAMAMGETAAENAMGGSSAFNAAASPSCVYVGPEFAGVGFTEEQLKARGIDYKVGRFPTSGNGKSLVMGSTDGMVKLISGAKYGEILGVHILAPRATDLIEEAALAIRLEATTDELIDTVHCHPTVSEALREAAMAAEKRAIHIPNKK
ncbi:MAG: dihydrolipoyl dehydrogenase [Oscillospiraceae bacterium]